MNIGKKTIPWEQVRMLALHKRFKTNHSQRFGWAYHMELIDSTDLVILHVKQKA